MTLAKDTQPLRPIQIDLKILCAGRNMDVVLAHVVTSTFTKDHPPLTLVLATSHWAPQGSLTTAVGSRLANTQEWISEMHKV
jgi:hypothetical protein